MSLESNALRKQTAGIEPERHYRCSVAARWLPRTLAAAILAAAMLSAFRLAGTGEPLLPTVRQFVVLAGAILALGVARKGSEVRCRFGLTVDSLTVSIGARHLRLGLDEIQRLDYAVPFGGSTDWLPATVIIDRDGRSWRIPAVVEQGDQLFLELLRRAGRHDLDSWAEVYRIVPRMARYRLRVRIGYGVAAAILLVGLGYYLH